MEAWKLTGYRMTEERFTLLSFKQFQREKPNISLDEAILKFENAAPNITLDEFAKQKHRTAESYRNTYKKYFSQ